MLYASVNPEYFSAADGKALSSLLGVAPARGAFGGVADLGEGVCILSRPLRLRIRLRQHCFYFKSKFLALPEYLNIPGWLGAA